MTFIKSANKETETLKGLNITVDVPATISMIAIGRAGSSWMTGAIMLTNKKQARQAGENRKGR
ncbi:hypothetical protein BsIDN1_05800 [Bacillus safensis]|uniref:Uncharacterized protein n=1 Tax=Bacillus safensis TaxID=561879 RepID=A0A5S9M2K0_BACIA|nr:hypothetical protein BsIDN1_05800 [Bacillus safensis]